MIRHDSRAKELRKITIETNVLNIQKVRWLFRLAIKVICSATVEEKVPHFKRRGNRLGSS